MSEEREDRGCHEFDEVFSVESLADPYPSIASLAAHRIARGRLMGLYSVYSFDDVFALLKDREMLRDPRRAAPDSLTYRMFASDPFLDGSMLFADPPNHTRLRGLVSRAFTPRAIEALRPRVQELARELLDAVGSEPCFDLMPSFAEPLPTLVIAEMLGVDPADHGHFKQWSDALVAGLDPFLPPEQAARVEAARVALRSYLHGAVDRRRAHRRDDVIGRLIEVQDGDDRLTDDEIVTTCALLLTAGNVTTTDLIGNGVLALLQHPEQLAALRERPALLPNAIEEMLRYDPPVVRTSRVLSRDMEVAGCPISAGQTVMAVLGGANRDPAANADPERFDIERAEPRHLAFGGGLHYCLGAALARMEAQVAFEALLARFPQLRLDPARELEYRTVPSFHGLKHLPLTTRA